MIAGSYRLRYGHSVDYLTVKPGLIASILRAVGLVKVDNTGKVEHSAGADFVEDYGFKGGYDTKTAMSALAAFPWPFSCVQAISTDLSKVPLRAYRGRGSEAEMLDTHPVLELLKQSRERGAFSQAAIHRPCAHWQCFLLACRCRQ